ncbi:hypothetical protein J2S09_000863 [Bacillus fengqiuensis]|nr:hypothetical protein [Bacillus fengqiuensis]
MWRESKLVLSDFVYKDRFELSSYLIYLFNPCYDHVSNQSEDTMGKQLINKGNGKGKKIMNKEIM